MSPAWMTIKLMKETDLIEMGIRTGNVIPGKVPACRMPFAVHQEVSRQHQNMQEAGVIQPFVSPWASPIVMVSKKDGSQILCRLPLPQRSKTKADTYPLPRVDHFIDQLGESSNFTAHNLASGYWQICVFQDPRKDSICGVPRIV